MNKVVKYTIITLLLLFGLFCIGIIFLFFVPDSSIFGVTYISKSIELKTDPIAASSVSNITINSRSYYVTIKSTDDSSVHAEMRSKSFGFVNKKNKTPTLSQLYKDNTITLNITEPHGCMAKNGSTIALYLPKNKAFNISINNKNATVAMDDSNVKINDLNYSSEKGKLKLISGSINGEIDLNLAKSQCTVSEHIKTNNNALRLNITSGSFIATESSFGNIEVTQNKRGTIKIHECKDFIFKPITAGGVVVIDKLEQAQISTSDTNVYLGAIASGGTINVNASGNIHIANLTGAASITTHTGSIKVLRSNSPLFVKSKSGDITINEAYQPINVEANSGKVYIAFSQYAKTGLNSATNEYFRTLHANIHDANLTAYGVEHLGAIGSNSGFVSTGDGKVSIYMDNVYGQNAVKTASNNLFIQVEKSAVYTLTTASAHGSLRVNLAQIPEYNGYTETASRTTFVNSHSQSSNTLTVSTEAGSLTLLDTLVH